MFLLIVIVVLFVLYKMGFLRKTAECACCGESLKGNKQIICKKDIKKERFVVCKKCLDKIPNFMSFDAEYKWDKDQFVDYCNWYDSFEDKRKLFKPTLECGSLKIDVINKLFSIGEYTPEKAIYSFDSVFGYDISCTVDEDKAKRIGSKHTTLYIYLQFILGNPVVAGNECINITTCRVSKDGLLHKNRNYAFEHGEEKVLQMFSALVYEAQHKNSNNNVGIDELQKALALFMFDSLNDITVADIKAQRNALIKAFHPDNADANASYSQKINAAYDVLMKAVG